MFILEIVHKEEQKYRDNRIPDKTTSNIAASKDDLLYEDPGDVIVEDEEQKLNDKDYNELEDLPTTRAEK